MQSLMGDAQVRRFTALAGCGAFLFYLVSALLILDAPSIDSAPRVLAAYAMTHRTALFLEVVMWGLATCAVVAFAAGLWAVLRRAEGEPAVFAMLVGLALLLTQTLVLSGLSALLVLGYRADTLALSTVQLLFDLTYLGAALSAFPTALAMLAFAVLNFRTAAFPVWTAWLAVVVALLHLIAGVSFAPSGLFSPSGVGVYVAPPAFFVWILAVGLVLLRTRASQRVPAARSDTTTLKAR